MRISHDLPQKFNSKIYRTLVDFNSLLFFKWDLLSDNASFTPNPLLSYKAPAHKDHFSFTLLCTEIVHPADQYLIENILNEIFSPTDNPHNTERHDDFELRIFNTKGFYTWTKLRSVIYFKEGLPTILFGSLQDINSQKEQEISLQREVEHDPLTGLYNKAACHRLISKYFHTNPDTNRYQSLLLIDADNFKTINDTFGHLFGDAVITDMAMEFEKYFRRDDIVGRIGGDEFLVLLKDIPSIDLLNKKCAQLIQNLHRSYKNGDETVTFSISIGIALFPDHGTSFHELFQRADKALYSCKSKGKSCFALYEPGIIVNKAGLSRHHKVNLEEFQQKAFKDNMIEFTFRLLYETKNPEATISIALSLLGKQFNIDRVIIRQYNKDMNAFHKKFEWLSPKAFPLEEDSTDPAIIDALNQCNNAIMSLYKATPYGEISVCTDTLQLSAEYTTAFTTQHIHSFIYSKIMRGSEMLGCIGFEYNKEPRIWTDDEYNHLSIFSSILGNVLMTQDSNPKLIAKNHYLTEIIDNIQDLVYVIDKDTYEVLFFNRTIRQAIPETTTAQKCYARFHNRTSPCTNCPAHELTNGAEYIIRKIKNEEWNIMETVQIINIEWENHRKACLLIARPE
ncbi:MAG: diguanylate cyclase [Selenomonadaceae bacterium]